MFEKVNKNNKYYFDVMWNDFFLVFFIDMYEIINLKNKLFFWYLLNVLFKNKKLFLKCVKLIIYNVNLERLIKGLII